MGYEIEWEEGGNGERERPKFLGDVEEEKKNEAIALMGKLGMRWRHMCKKLDGN